MWRWRCACSDPERSNGLMRRKRVGFGKRLFVAVIGYFVSFVCKGYGLNVGDCKAVLQ